MTKLVIILYIFTTFLLMANNISYDGMLEEKKDVIKFNDKFKDLSIEGLNFELSNLNFDKNTNVGEAYLNQIEEENNSFKKISTTNYIISDKSDKIIKTGVSFEKEDFLEEAMLSYGANVSYLNHKINKDNSNGVLAGVILKFKLPDYNVIMNLKQDFIYSNISYNKKFNQNYMGALGGLDLSTVVGTNFYIRPGLALSYIYNLKTELKDHNNDVIKIEPVLNMSAKAYSKIGYKNDKFDVSLGYGLEKRFNNKNEYIIYDRKIKKDSNNYINHNFELSANLKLNESNIIGLSISKTLNGYKGGLVYDYVW